MFDGLEAPSGHQSPSLSAAPHRNAKNPRPSANIRFVVSRSTPPAMNEKRMSIKKDTTPRPTRLTRAEIINKMVQKIDTKNATDRVMILSFRRESLEAKGNSCPEVYFEQKLIYISIYE